MSCIHFLLSNVVLSMIINTFSSVKYITELYRRPSPQQIFSNRKHNNNSVVLQTSVSDSIFIITLNVADSENEYKTMPLQYKCNKSQDLVSSRWNVLDLIKSREKGDKSNELLELLHRSWCHHTRSAGFIVRRHLSAII